MAKTRTKTKEKCEREREGEGEGEGEEQRGEGMEGVVAMGNTRKAEKIKEIEVYLGAIREEEDPDSTVKILVRCQELLVDLMPTDFTYNTKASELLISKNCLMANGEYCLRFTIAPSTAREATPPTCPSSQTMDLLILFPKSLKILLGRREILIEFRLLIAMLSSDSPPQHKIASQQISSRTSSSQDFLDLFFQMPHSLDLLLLPLLSNNTRSSQHAHVDPTVETNLVKTLYLLSLPKNKRDLLLTTPNLVTVLIHSLNNGTLESKANAAAILYKLGKGDFFRQATICKNKAVLPSLLNLLPQRNRLLTKDLLRAIKEFTSSDWCVDAAVHCNAIPLLMNNYHPKVSKYFVMTLLQFSECKTALNQMKARGAIPILRSIIHNPKGNSLTKLQCIMLIGQIHRHCNS